MTHEDEQVVARVTAKLTGDLTGTRFTTQMGLVRRVTGPTEGNPGYWKTVSEDDDGETTYWWGGYVLEHRV